MPSHLDSIDKRDKRTIFTLTGVCDESDIAGNVEADRLAALGAAAQNVPEDIMDEAKDRVAVASIIQRHLVRSWEHWHTSDRGGILACVDDMTEARAASDLAGDSYGDVGTYIEDDDYPEDLPPDVDVDSNN